MYIHLSFYILRNYNMTTVFWLPAILMLGKFKKNTRINCLKKEIFIFIYIKERLLNKVKNTF